jgi:hypothetical protein
VKIEPKILPLSGVSFREIIQGNFLYADKTKFIHKMIEHYMCCYLTRPMRFGKTLLLDTLDELFRGNGELFDSLWISTDSPYGFARHPVLRFNMAYEGISTEKDLIDNIKDDLRNVQKSRAWKSPLIPMK